MPLIHVEPEPLRNLSYMMERQVNCLLEEEFRLEQAAMSLEIAWIGGSAQDFMDEIRKNQLCLHRLLQELYLLAIKLARYSECWEESDLAWQALFRDQFHTHPPLGGGE